jgi:SAM-dependent methyltransferase
MNDPGNRSDQRKYEASHYWEERLGEEPTLQDVAYPSLPETFNRQIYRAMKHAVIKALRKRRIRVEQARVLDIGSGSGVWVDLWDRLGARSICGVDLTAAAVLSLSKRYPTHEFHQADVAKGVKLTGRFDLISAMSVLLHIKDDEGFRRAVANLAALLESDGFLFVMDQIVLERWWGPPFDEFANSKARPIDEWASVLRDSGLVVDNVDPVTIILSNPTDTKRRETFTALSLYWAYLERGLRGRERLGAVAGRSLYAIDRLLLATLKQGPSVKLLVARPMRS